ncbi:MAG: pentapeptide repeat-containing protein [Mycobacterium sp.]
MHWTETEFVGRDFRDDDLSRLHTEQVVFTECDFSGVNLAESQHHGSAFRNCTFNLTTLWHSTFRQCSMLGSVFVRCQMRPVTLDEVDFTLAVLGGNDLRGIDFSGCRLREASLVEADLRKSLLRGVDLTGARTTGTRMDDADLRGATVDPSLWTTASLTRARIDIEQALAYAVAHGLRLDGG